MAQLFKNKYRIPSARLEGWDYSRNAMYFVTICTKERKHFFGEITGGKMTLSDTGKLCEEYLYKIPVFSPFVLIDEAIIMPNHLHVIFVIDNFVDAAEETSLETFPQETFFQETFFQETFFQETFFQETFFQETFFQETFFQETFFQETFFQETFFQTSLQHSSISPKSGSLSTIIRSFKGAVKKDSKPIDPSFEWQTRFHDHIIRNQNSYWNIKKYIQTNVDNWKDDRFFNS